MPLESRGSNFNTVSAKRTRLSLWRFIEPRGVITMITSYTDLLNFHQNTLQSTVKMVWGLMFFLSFFLSLGSHVLPTILFTDRWNNNNKVHVTLWIIATPVNFIERAKLYLFIYSIYLFTCFYLWDQLAKPTFHSHYAHFPVGTEWRTDGRSRIFFSSSS